MALVKPFRAIRYNPDRIPDLRAVVSQPYDRIDDDLQERYYQLSPYNIVRIIQGKSETGDAPEGPNPYTRARDYLATWQRSGVLAREPGPAFYAYEQVFTVGESEYRRLGLIAAVQLAEFDEGIVLPHERTHSGPKEDRLRLLTALETHTEQIFMLYPDPENRVNALLRQAIDGQPPDIDVVEIFESGVRQRVWRIAQPDILSAIEREMEPKRNLIIADGHHRYETALAYREAQRQKHGSSAEAPWEYVSMFLCNTDAGQLTILPSHRLIKELPLEAEAQLWRSVMDVFETERVTIDSSSDQARADGIHALLDRMSQTEPNEHCFALYAGGNYALLLHLNDLEHAMAHGVADLPPANRSLDVALLHKLLIEGIMGLTGDMAATGVNVLFSRDGHDAANRVARGEAAMVLYVNTTRVEQVMAIATAGQKMPQKGTYFYPKALAGIVLHDLRPEA